MSYDKIDWSKLNVTSAQPCGCDPGANYSCENTDCAWRRAVRRELAEAVQLVAPTEEDATRMFRELCAEMDGTSK
jgi:hypothetical protein